MNKIKLLRKMLKGDEVIRIAGAHNAMCAKLIEKMEGCIHPLGMCRQTNTR